MCCRTPPRRRPCPTRSASSLTAMRELFDEDAELYDRARPGYPPEMFDDLAELAGVGAAPPVLGIAFGAGQATAPPAEQRRRVTAGELGPPIAAVGLRHLPPLPQRAEGAR